MVACWKKEYSVLKASNNYFGVFSTTYGEILVKAFIFTSCSINEFGNKRVMFANLFFKANENEITDGIVHTISDDCFELVKQNLSDNSLFQTAFISNYSIEKLPESIPFSFGDYSFR